MNKFCPGNGSCGSSGCQCGHPVTPSEKRCEIWEGKCLECEERIEGGLPCRVHPTPDREKEAFVCLCWMSRSVNGYTTQRNPECQYHGDTPSAPTPGEVECPCDFHTKNLTEEEARIALFKPIVGGEEAPPLVLIERFHHLWDARRQLLHETRQRTLEECVKAVTLQKSCKSCFNSGWSLQNCRNCVCYSTAQELMLSNLRLLLREESEDKKDV